VRITKIQLGECQIPLPRVLRLGPVEIRTRDYVVLRVETDSGIAGEAVGYSRGTPLLETLKKMAQRIVGADVQMRREILFSLEQSNLPARAALTRGLSMIDIALWDIACKKAGMPLVELLGRLRKSAPVTMVAGYYVDQRSIPDVVDEVLALADGGYQRVKIMLKGDDAGFDRKYVSAVAEKRPGYVAADAHWSWRTLTEAKRLCRDLDAMELSFLEDPFSASDISLTRELRSEMETPVAAGEDVFGAGVVADLIGGIDILRVDATTIGGITGAIEAIGLAAGAGRTVLPHVFSPLHVHLACAFPNVEGVEMIPSTAGADPIDRILRNLPSAQQGLLSPSEEPGAGIVVDWEAVGRLAQQSAIVTR
jgi:L-alanine-DL-glutamate epimerase-like enolase superfamily enzyme